MGKINKESYIINDKELILRTAEVQDSERIINLLKKIDEETTFMLREPGEFQLSLEQEEKILQDMLASKTSTLIAAEFEGKIIGTCGINGNTRKRISHIASLGIAIEKEYWSQGIGRKLMEAGIKWAKVSGITRLTLEVDTDNYKALSLYLKLGFEIEGTHRNDKRLADGSYKSGYSMALLW
ncbi:GNAT family N-acetyltransferase [Candidatus Clostridium stratigraminis]|uniref:GNAT family N-acetyltransferase n=1 Tax=Candidatus Clostridium stratigraminis TaxID=3381661 RepID=A0ABW8T479_9CLOT